MEGLKDTRSINSTMGQNQAIRIEGGRVSNIIEDISPKLFKIGSLTDSKSVPNRSTVADNRQGAIARAKSYRFGEFPRERIRRDSQN